MPKADEMDLESVDLEADEGPEIVVLTERTPRLSVEEYFVGMIEEILGVRLAGTAVHDHITDTNTPEPWLGALLGGFVKEEDVFIVVQKVLDSNEELKDFVLGETRAALRANLDTIGSAVKGALEDIGVFERLDATDEKMSAINQLVDNKNDKGFDPQRVLQHAVEFRTRYILEMDGIDGDSWGVAHMLEVAGWAQWARRMAEYLRERVKEHGLLLVAHTERINELEQRIEALEAAGKKTTTKTKSKESTT